MKRSRALVRTFQKIALTMAACLLTTMVASAVQIAFDLPSSIECRDVTSKEFASANPNLKMVEGKFHISSWIDDGTAGSIIDFVYTFKANQTMRIQDYTPNTTLESAVAEDHIEITDAKEDSSAAGLDGHLAYHPLTIGSTLNQSSKKSEASHYKQIAAKDTVLSSGTIDREHGIIFRIRPSRTAAIEGAKEFTFVAVVPRGWRGDMCTISCTGRTPKHTMLTKSVISAGSKTAIVGLYLSGDGEAAALAEQLRVTTDTYDALFAVAKSSNVVQMISTQASSVFGGLTKSDRRKKLQEAKDTMLQTRDRLTQLAK